MLATLGWSIVVACLWLVKACFFVCVSQGFGVNMWNLFTFCGHVDAHACRALLADRCCFSVVCHIWRLHLGIYDRCVLKLVALWVHFVGMRMHMFANFVCGLLLLVCGLSKLAVSLGHL